MNKAVFLDRDGVLIRDIDLLTKSSDIALLPKVPAALKLFKQFKFFIFIITNQTVIARGMASEEDVARINLAIDTYIAKENGPTPDGYYICPHHPSATLEKYRMVCDCRKPEPGLLLRAAREHDIDLSRSFMIGDRITDIISGYKAGCQTILVQTGKHSAPPIETSKRIDTSIKPDKICIDLFHAAQWIVGKS